MAKPEPGTIVRVLGINDDKKFRSKPWGVAVNDGNTNSASRVCVYMLTLKGDAKIALDTPTNGQAPGWWLYANEYTVVPEDEVPDHVWSTLGAIGLLGDLTTC